MATCVNRGRDFETSHDKPFPKDGGGKTLMAIHLWFWLPTLAPDNAVLGNLILMSGKATSLAKLITT